MAGIQREELLRYVLQTDESAEEEDMFELLVHEKVSQDVNHIHVDRQSFGDRMADKLAGFAGSWKFIIGFIVVLLSWIAVNAFLLSSPFDPFPFILLNLFLSCVAAIQAPVIMMSPEPAGGKGQAAGQERLQGQSQVRAYHRGPAPEAGRPYAKSGADSEAAGRAGAERIKSRWFR